MATNFGREVSCTDRLRTGRFSRGVRVVAEAAYRRLITPRGSLLNAPNYGFDMTSMVGSAKTSSDAFRLPGLIKSELLKDERIEDVAVEVTETIATSGAVTWLVRIDCTTAEGPFALQVGITDVSLDLLGIEA